LVPEQKIRCQTPLFDAGGGINVSKAIQTRGKITCVITSGGSTGEMLKKLYKKNLLLKPLKREVGHGNFVAVDDNTNSQFRFVFRHPLQSLKR
jgi:6-phosphofructokinase 2